MDFSSLARREPPQSPGKRTENHGASKNQISRTTPEVALAESTWDDLNEPGAYVERGTGDLYRIPKEAIIHKESTGASRLVQVSKNPFVTTLEARLRCAQHNIDPNF